MKLKIQKTSCQARSEGSVFRPKSSRVAKKRSLTHGLSRVLPLFAIVLFGSITQDPFPEDYFRSPLGIPLMLSGSFAEMRSNHFHSGLDIKTRSRSGYRIYAAADGWISRIAVSPTGFGNALYISHPNGYMTVYAHLDRFTDEVASYVKSLQYRKESFRLNTFPEKSRFPVAKGDVIAFSGNSGSTSGPHLHFEIRNSDTGWPVNPLLFGINVPDTRPPRIVRIKLYAIDSNSRIRIKDARTGGWRSLDGGESVILDVTRKGGINVLARASRIEAVGRIGFGVQAHDYHNGSSSRLGAYGIDLTTNGGLLFSSLMERFSFDQTRYINAHVDYSEYVSNRRWVQRSFVLPGNKLPIYRAVEHGLLTVEDGHTYEMVYRISDVFGNDSVLPFKVYGTMKADQATTAPNHTAQSVYYNRPFSLAREGIRLDLPPNTVYENIEFEYEKLTRSPRGAFAPVHRIHNRRTPVHSLYTISIDASALPGRLREKALLARVDESGTMRSAGGSYKNGFITGSVREFGDYTIAVDTIAPSIRPLNISAGKNMTQRSNIRFRIRDNFSGIRSYSGEIDGNWVLFVYDAKSGQLRYTFDESVGRGNHHLRLEVEDNVLNKSVYEADFAR